MVSRERRNIERAISSLRSYEPQKIILFGSQARGDDDKHSDLDLVVIKETYERFLDRLGTIYDLVQPDLRAARYNREGGFHAVACFQAQQAGEKALKASLFARGERVVLGHSIAELGQPCAT